MENERISKVSSFKCHLPEELCRDILSRLPVKSLLRFRCVSKSWLSLINDPEFCRVHLKNFKNNRDETHLLVVEGPQDFVVRCSDTFKTSAETLVTFPPRCRAGEWDVNCSIDGLVLLENYGSDNSGFGNDLVVWNPSIGKFHYIPPLPVMETPRNSSFFDVNLGLGYDPLVKDYKHVKLIFVSRGTLPHSVAVYTLGESSWKMIQFQGKECSNWQWKVNPHLMTVCLRGSFYFISTNLNSDREELVSFDLSSEAFSSISLPDAFTNPPGSDDNHLLVGNGCSSLALFGFGWGTVMWAVLESSGTESESLCWTKPCLLKLDFSAFFFLKKNRDMLMRGCSNKEKSFNLATDMSSVQNCSVVPSYNLETGEEKQLLLQKLESECYGAYGFIESLVLLK